MSRTHWKKLTNPNYLGSWDIPEGSTLTVEIISVAKELVTGVGGEKEECIVAKIKNQKPLILNKTNCKTLSKVFESNYIEDWKGKSCVLITEKVKAFGDVVDAIRVKKVAVQVSAAKPKLSAERLEAAKLSVIEGKTTINFIRSKFDLSATDLLALQEAYRQSDVALEAGFDEATKGQDA